MSDMEKGPHKTNYIKFEQLGYLFKEHGWTFVVKKVVCLKCYDSLMNTFIG